ncbi:MAG TPA: HAMP domain-containing sensor histidine kinase [Gaiellaceae bacterium]|nr:HAMP domain-containing sensor histidine kinase [Gaiellaceae bacterium]
MYRSLRFKLPAIFLTGIVLAGLVSTALAVRLFQQYTHNRTETQLRREARGIAALYVDIGIRGLMENFRGETMSQATGDLVYYAPRAVGIVPFPGQPQPLNTLPPLKAKQIELLDKGRTLTLTIDPPGETGALLAAAAPVRAGRIALGAVVVGTPKSQLRSNWLTLIERLALAFAGGILVAGALGWYLSRRITRPVLALSDAADAISRGNYEVDLPAVRGGDEIGHLAGRFREMAARLAEAEQLERNFLMSVSHELRTPLTAIRGHVSAIREGLIDDPELQDQSLEIVESESVRLERLVQDVLDLAKLDTHRFTVLREEVDMEALIDRAYGAFAEEARRRGIEYRRELRAAPVIETDGDRVLQIISNLLANAFRWTPDRGRIGVELVAGDGTVAVAVEDTGPGIARADQERIFRAFWSRDDAGTGLGLAIARELAVALGGRIELASEVGFGSRFELVLPATEVRYAEPAVAQPASPDEERRSSIR